MALLTDLDVAPGWPRWRRSMWYHFAFYRLTWRASVAATFAFPLMYLASMGLGVGKLVNQHTGLIEGHTYLQFVAPALVAVAATQMGEQESLWPVLASVKWVRSYHAAVATPLEPEDVIMGKISWVTVRLFFSGTIYLAIIAAFGVISSWWGLLLPFVAVLTGLAFATPLMAYALTRETDASFTTIYRFLLVPMFLFSATFFPVSVYPPHLRWIVEIMPLYHGVELARACAFGEGSASDIVVHLSVLIGLLVVGLVYARRNVRRRLVN